MKNSTPSLNVVMLTTVRFHKSKGGTEKVMIDTANALVALGHKVSIIFHDKRGSEPGFALNESVHIYNCKDEKIPISLSGIFREIRSFDISKNKRQAKQAFLKLKMLASRFGRFLRSLPADVYITYEPKLSAMLVKEFNIKGNVITTFQFNPQHIAKRVDTKHLEKYISTAGPIQILRNEFLEETKKYFPSAKQITIISNTIPEHSFKSKLDSKIIINVGRFSEQKNQILLAKSFALISKKYPDWKVQIWGETEIEKSTVKQIREIIRQYNIKDNFFICGPTDNILEKLNNSSIFAFPSTDEGFGLAMVEAMSVGLPCIGLNTCPAVNTIIRNEENGLLSENNPDAFSLALSRLIESYELRQRLGSQAKFDSQKFSPFEIWNQWNNLLIKCAKTTKIKE